MQLTARSSIPMGRLNTSDLHLFFRTAPRRYRWLVAGELKGLLRTVRARSLSQPSARLFDLTKHADQTQRVFLFLLRGAASC